MAPRSSRIPLIGTSSTQSAHSENITPAPNLPWQFVGPARDHLLDRLNKLYWDGVKGELEVIIRTLRTWQQPQYQSVIVNDENDDFVHGFDTFIDQVSQKSRAFAHRYGTLAVEPVIISPKHLHIVSNHNVGKRKEERAQKNREKNRGLITKPNLKEALLSRALDLDADKSSSEIKTSVREAIEGDSSPWLPSRMQTLIKNQTRSLGLGLNVALRCFCSLLVSCR